jgi:hypothetical protein
MRSPQIEDRTETECVRMSQLVCRPRHAINRGASLFVHEPSVSACEENDLWNSVI